MAELVSTAKFERAFRRLTRKNPAIQPQLEAALRRLSEDPGDSRLKTHHLSGRLAGLHACSAGCDCRIVFQKSQHPQTGSDVLLLINIGSHEEVY